MEITGFTVGGVAVSFLAGLLSFLSPCVLPLVPAYLGYVSGLSVAEIKSGKGTGRVVLGIIFFVLGFSLVFVLMGATASAVGQFLIKNKRILGWIAGPLLAIFGMALLGFFSYRKHTEWPSMVRWLGWGLFLAVIFLPIFLFSSRPVPAIVPIGYLLLVSLVAWFLNFLNVINFDFINYEAKAEVHSKGANVFVSFVMGAAFALGWTPCIGPILSGILGLAAMSETLWQGMILLFVYSLGLGVPFILSGIFAAKVFEFIRSVRGLLRTFEIVSGLLLILLGILLVTNWIQQIAYLLPQWELPL
ncbi:MAG: hypothetical protein GXO39_03460 [Thermotogae bacterium]|nr:hypothetical protein [Thermotogota bacterium]